VAHIHGPTTGELTRRAKALLRAAHACGIEHPNIVAFPDGTLRLEGSALTVAPTPPAVNDPNPWDLALGR
jgi:hypothetical protein